jgi:ribosomal protein RSM22 (predicted rRNA methylase)
VSWTVDPALEEALWAAAKRRLPTEFVGGPGLSAAVVDRSRRYTSERDKLAAPSSPNGDLAARALFFTIADAAKVRVPLAELAGRGLDPRGAVRVLDVGAGCGAMTLGLLEHLASQPGGAESKGAPSLDVTLIDRDADALAIAADAIRTYADALGIPATITVRRASTAEPLPAGPFDLALAGSVLNELSAADRAPLVTRMLAAITPGGAVLVIEPALRQTARDLEIVRDEVLARGAAHVFAPCTRQVARCPMLDDERDWCHEERALDLPPRAMRIAINTGLRDGAMKFSYLVLRHGAEPLVEAGSLARRVVSEPLKSKGKLELFGCSDEGRVRLRLLHRHRNDQTRGFERARRGDVLAGVTSADVAPTDTVDRIRPAHRGGGDGD